MCRKRADVGDIRKIFFTMEDTETTKIEREEIARPRCYYHRSELKKSASLRATKGEDRQISKFGNQKRKLHQINTTRRSGQGCSRDKKRYEKEMAAYNNNK
uniref:Uncharacterized protein n=1 Tax=Ditylenchus dipsaci TaxID=166011 RepID=A0A915CL69_9BILA